MDPSAPSSRPGDINAARTGAVPGGKQHRVRDRRWRAGLLAPLMFLIGSVLWLIGAGLFAGSQERYLVRLLPGGNIGTGAIIDSGLRTAAWILWIIASIFFILGALVHLANSFAQAAIVTINNRRPGIAKWAIFAAFLQLAAVTLILIGSAVWSGGALGEWSAGAIIILAGFTLWTHAVLIAFAIAYIVSTVVPLMPDFKQRRYAWSSVSSILVLLVALIIYNIAAITLVVRDAPGIALTSAILFIVASVYFIFGWLLNLRGAHGFYTPVWAFATENVTSETLAGGETASKPRTQLMAEPGGNIPSKGATQLAAEPRGVGISGTTAPVGAAHTQVVV